MVEHTTEGATTTDLLRTRTAQLCAVVAPPLDTVLLWLTNTVERDYEVRGAFPALRHSSARDFRGPSALHYLSADEAESVLEDAMARKKSVSSGVRNAYRAHIKGLEAAMKEAAERPAAFASTDAVCVYYQAEHVERWRGTKDQLQGRGIQLDGPWPHEQGGKRWVHVRDSRGYKTSITRFSTIWPGLYEARITIPYEVWGPKEVARRPPDTNEADLAKRNLASMPASADDFRAHVVESMRRFVRLSLEMATEPASWHGYTLDEDAAGEIHAGFDAVVEAIVGARVKFDQARHAEIAQKYRAQIAAGDKSFQAQFDTLSRPNPRLLEGGAQ